MTTPHDVHLTQTAELLRELAKTQPDNKDFPAVAKFLESLADVYRKRQKRTLN